ncbi:hypothetical protein DFR67_108114 [Williamsia limnetica]|uniref:Uncharacterized protein n=1 Tax=Williamsia limnetica TaxID=882452 RepID=A0A318RNP8_WILLI|nr:hypothetical protein [Williamsia limnetica]PYE16363.1 hypothetical protein DFR67_108114 [Williamsia limnetica]
MTNPSTPLRPGDQLASTTCATRVVVVKVPADNDVSIACGGAPMIPAATAEKIAGDGGTPTTLLGKRYTDADGTVELLCTSPGTGELTINGTPLSIKSAKPLPASD